MTAAAERGLAEEARRAKLVYATNTLKKANGVQSLNDHSDAEYDSGVVKRLVELHAELVPLLQTLDAALSRYGAYLERRMRVGLD